MIIHSDVAIYNHCPSFISCSLYGLHQSLLYLQIRLCNREILYTRYLIIRYNISKIYLPSPRTPTYVCTNVSMNERKMLYVL